MTPHSAPVETAALMILALRLSVASSASMSVHLAGVASSRSSRHLCIRSLTRASRFVNTVSVPPMAANMNEGPTAN